MGGGVWKRGRSERVSVGREREQGRRETRVMKCEICLWRRRGIRGGAGNQELRGGSGRRGLGDACVGLQAAVFQPAVACLPP